MKGMYALRERRQHVTQEDFEFAIAKVGVHVFDLKRTLLITA
jgi:ATP-dependent 26S proteasome regulatory subunit